MENVLTAGNWAKTVQYLMVYSLQNLIGSFRSCRQRIIEYIVCFYISAPYETSVQHVQ